MLKTSIIPAKAKLERKKAPQHLRKALIDFVPNAMKTIATKNNSLMAMFKITGMFSIKIISEKNPPAADARIKRAVLI
jgi:hypothetical protein